MNKMSHVTFRVLRARANKEQRELRRAIDDANRVNQRVTDYLDADKMQRNTGSESQAPRPPASVPLDGGYK